MPFPQNDNPQLPSNPFGIDHIHYRTLDTPTRLNTVINKYKITLNFNHKLQTPTDTAEFSNKTE